MRALFTHPGRIVVVVIAFFLLLLVAFYSIYRVSTPTTSTLYATEFTLIEPSVQASIAYNTESGDTFLFVSGHPKRLLSAFPRQPVAVLVLPTTDALLNLATVSPVSTLTWNLSLKESVAYVNYLLAQGYSKSLTVSTPYYVEIYLQKDHLFKRLIIQDHSLMAGDLKANAVLPSLTSLLNSVSYLGGIKV